MRSFASDNNSGVHPLVMDAVIKANDNHAVGYGDDPWTAAATAKIKEVFGEMASPFFVFNGTGANTVALQAVTRPFNSILCAETAHINVDECGAPARMTGCAIVTIPAPDGKLTPELIKPRLHNFGVCHHSQPKAVYISQVSELGTIYTIEEVKAIADLLHSYNMYLHMDGARLANACAYLNCSMRILPCAISGCASRYSAAVMISATPALSSAPSSVVPSVWMSVCPLKNASSGKSATRIVN